MDRLPPRGPRESTVRAAAALRRRAPELAAALFGLLWFLAVGGYRALPPTALGWLGQGDHAQHLLGWLFFRRSRWALPLGRIDGFVWPSGTTVGFTDSNPLLALAGKLASPLLPRDFQYIGLWLGACFALQGYFGARLTALASPRPRDRALGGALFALSPVLLERVGHDTLCAHFALLLMIRLHLGPAEGRPAARRALAAAAVLVAVLAAVHPYLSVMALVLALALLWKLAAKDRLLGGAEAAGLALLLLAAQAAVLLAFGFLTTAPAHGPGFGQFATDLAAFVNPLGRSSVLPALPSAPGGWEGYAYLGLGGLALGAVAAGLVARRPPPRERLEGLVPLALASLLLYAFALSSAVRIAGRTVLDLGPFYQRFTWLLGPLRASGRFAWPLFYLLLAGAVSVPLVALRERPRLATALLAGAVLLELADLAPLAVGSRFAPRPWRLEDPTWLLARGRYQHLALVPPQVVGVAGPCRGELYGDDDYWAPLAYEAYRLGMTFNSGFLARGDHERLARPCLELLGEVAAGELRPDTLYVVHPSLLAALRPPRARCGRLEGYLVCVRADAAGPFAAALSLPP